MLLLLLLLDFHFYRRRDDSDLISLLLIIRIYKNNLHTLSSFMNVINGLLYLSSEESMICAWKERCFYRLSSVCVFMKMNMDIEDGYRKRLWEWLWKVSFFFACVFSFLLFISFNSCKEEAKWLFSLFLFYFFFFSFFLRLTLPFMLTCLLYMNRCWFFCYLNMLILCSFHSCFLSCIIITIVLSVMYTHKRKTKERKSQRRKEEICVVFHVRKT